jgi:hypothetical protein
MLALPVSVTSTKVHRAPSICECRSKGAWQLEFWLFEHAAWGSPLTPRLTPMAENARRPDRLVEILLEKLAELGVGAKPEFVSL